MDGAERNRMGFDPWAEQGVIGSMLIDPRCVGLVVSRMTEADFTLETNKRIFLAFRERFAKGQVMDPIMILGDVSPEDPALRQYILQLMDATPTAANVEPYIEEAKRLTKLSRIREIGCQLSAVVEPGEAAQLLKGGQALLSEQGRDDEADMDRATLDFYEYLEKTPDFLPWGFPLLDDNLDVSGGNFVVIGGRPSDGKTALALHMAFEQAKTKNVGFFTLEDSKDVLYSRLKSAISGVPLRNILRRRLSDAEYRLLAASDDEIRSRRLTLIESFGWTAEEIIARSNYHKFDVIYVDYLQYIRGSGKGRPGRYDEISDISRELAREARSSKTTVVALAQLSRPQEKGLRGAPTMAALKESGQIEQDANVIMFVWRRDETSSQTKRYLTIAKNKLGPLGEWKIMFNGSIQRFYPDLVEETPEEAKEPLEDHGPEPKYQQMDFESLPENIETPWG